MKKNNGEKKLAGFKRMPTSYEMYLINSNSDAVDFYQKKGMIWSRDYFGRKISKTNPFGSIIPLFFEDMEYRVGTLAKSKYFVPTLMIVIFFLAIYISMESSGLLDNVDIGQAIKDFLDLNPN